ncbi:proline--tRNA ligase [Saccharomycopsis crataegensis]|uniref:proline--tRNA ligase n=1 Tax=Saccharomycopsis crataegensis TaxID=43959 RepID=A0AAV5QP41_9ASCO|nr:proline--tRNA ligase [Saccharomycopsis crataegensis]
MSSLEASLAALSLYQEVPEGAIQAKSLVFKEKKSGSPVVLIALSSTKTDSKVVAKSVSGKEVRIANDDFVNEHFKVNAKEFSIANINTSQAGKYKIVLDSQIACAESSAVLVLSTESSKLALEASKLNAYLKSTGIEIVEVDFTATPAAPAPAKKEKKEKKKVAAPSDAALDDAKLIGITVDKFKDFPNWYSQILTKGEMLDYYDVSGCYILRPPSYAVWEQIQAFFDKRIKSIGVQNAYFPMFVSSRVLEKEKDHIEGFAPEVAWVTRAGNSELDQPIAIRPTSETVMYPYYAKWIRSHRDLPLKLNQWNSVVRWEFKHPQPFLRTREFLWQEGHTAHLTAADAQKEVLDILGYYQAIYEELLAVPVIPGKKTEKEKFAGGDYTTTVEGYIPATGRGIQGATSHHLGQNFSKMFGISVENPEGKDLPKVNVYQNSWGLSTRVIGVMVMVHSDNKGLVIPPRVSQKQAVVIPVGITKKTTKEAENQIYEAAKDVEARLVEAGVRAIGDYRDIYSPGWKFSDWELKGLPIRIELGPKDLEKKSVTVVRRNDNKKYTVSMDNLEKEIPEILEELQKDLFLAAKEKFDTHRVIVENWDEFVPALNNKNLILSPWCGVMECEEDIKDSSAKKAEEEQDEEVDDKAPSMGAKSLCIPFNQPTLKAGTKCVKCARKAINYTMFGRSY